MRLRELPEIRVLVADDEPLARRGVRQMLAPHADVRVVGESRNGTETLRALDALRPDLLFLDVQMPAMDGFSVLRAHGPDRMPAVIFVTAHDEFAVQAFEAHALDYLVKPLNAQRFDSALRRVRERLHLQAGADLAKRLTALLAAEQKHREKNGIERLVVSTPSSNVVIPVGDIDWISAEDYYVQIHVRSQSYLLRDSLNSLESRLDPARFMRVHRSVIVQIDRVREIRTTERGDEAILQDGTGLPIGRRRRAELDDRLRGIR
jgi:two-component system, LytTR family, response regulator